MKKTNKKAPKKAVKTIKSKCKVKTNKPKTAPKNKLISKPKKTIKSNTKSLVKPKKDLKSRPKKIVKQQHIIKKNVVIKTTKSNTQRKNTDKEKSKKYNAKAGEIWYVNDKKTKGHKSIITKRRKSNYEMVEHIPITHSRKTNNIKNIKLQENPEKNNKSKKASRVMPIVQKTHYSNLGSKRDDVIIINPNDKAIIRHIKKKSKKNKH
ncbi:MAG: hypothetical protein IJX17_06535 [Clostridia bacterium]|nr:hypothetical protein [Clostridia bacterium]